ncbi:hypothetical protein FOB64_004143 [Candida albicans]|uniref:rRNA biogenesis protein RRP36 n=1 Tax=Candida albicans TaxID=5476 RepID=A0A8H6BV39_CANAX|nr:hypothetical protein FOB64_004143 [Candida albicans]
MSRGKTIRPSYYDEEESSQDELSHTLSKGRSNIGSQSDDEEMSKISFGALNRAQSKLNKHNQKHKTQEDNYKSSEEEFFDSGSDSDVSRIRDIPGLPSRKQQTLHTDIRFDAAYGKADLAKARKDYAFLDEYRKQEIANMESLLKDKKSN